LRYQEKKVRSVTDLLGLLAGPLRANEQIWFRGQAKSSWNLKPSLARKLGGLELEQSLVRRFKQNAFMLIDRRPQSEWEWLFVMQHHGVPTRLLDWTESPLVGLYFAVNERQRSSGALWAIIPSELNSAAGLQQTGPANIPAFDEDPALLGSYLPSALAGEQQSRLKTLAIIAPRNTTRSQAQLAVFTIAHRDLTPIERIADGRHVWRYLIPSSAKQHIRRELERLHITRLTLFPELVNVGTHAKEIL